MEIPVLVEPVRNDAYRARSGEPLLLEAQGTTEAEAVVNLKALLATRMATGAKVIPMEVPDSAAAASLPGAGIFQEDDPYVKVWIECMAERRRVEDAELDVPGVVTSSTPTH